MMRTGFSRRTLAGLVAAIVIVGVAGAAEPVTGSHGLVVTPLLRTTVSGDDSREAVIVKGEFAPGGTTGRHRHPGDEYATVIEGQLELNVDGEPPRRVTAGQAYHNAKGVVHETRNAGAVPARVVSTFVVDKGRPLIEPVASP
jgi:quercetin dioxygenase-like cupin family protein